MPSAAGREERQALTAYLTRNHLKRSAQREAILDAFVKAGHHVSVEDLKRWNGVSTAVAGKTLALEARSAPAKPKSKPDRKKTSA